MKFLHIIPYYIRATNSGGPGALVERLAQELKHLGHENTVVSSNGNMDKNIDLVTEIYPCFLTENGISTIYFKRDKRVLPFGYYYSRELYSWLKIHAGDFDLVIIHGIWTYFSLVGSLICRKQNIPYLIFPHGSFDPWAWSYHNYKKRPYWKFVEKRNIMNANGFIVLSEDEKEQIQKIIDSKIFIARNGIQFPVKKLDYQNSTKVHLLHSVTNKNFVLFLSRLHPKKGLEVLISAWASINEKFEGWKLVIAGPDENNYRKELEKLVKQFNLEDSVIFTGLVTGDDKISFLQECDFFILPSFGEGVPGAVIEALAYGKPVIITPGCHLPEVNEFHAGIIIEPEKDHLITAMSELISDYVLRESMGKNAQALAEKLFNEEDVAKNLVTFCEQEIINRAGRNIEQPI